MGSGLQTIYKAEEVIELPFGRILALAFLPVEEVVGGMAHVRGVSPMCMLPVSGYFGRTYAEAAAGRRRCSAETCGKLPWIARTERTIYRRRGAMLSSPLSGKNAPRSGEALAGSKRRRDGRDSGNPPRPGSEASGEN